MDPCISAPCIMGMCMTEGFDEFVCMCDELHTGRFCEGKLARIHLFYFCYNQFNLKAMKERLYVLLRNTSFIIEV